MALNKQTETKVDEAVAVAEATVEDNSQTDLGICVVVEGVVTASGFETTADAQAYIDQQITPQGLTAEVIE